MSADDLQIANIYESAAMLLERDGWCQRVYRVGSARCVTFAMIDAAETIHVPATAAIIAFCEWLGLVDPHHPDRHILHSWNDNAGTTMDIVVVRLREAARMLRGGGVVVA